MFIDSVVMNVVVFTRNADCYWRIDAPTSGETVIVNIEFMDLEGYSAASCSYDTLSIYDGTSKSITSIALYTIMT